MGKAVNGDIDTFLMYAFIGFSIQAAVTNL